MDMKTRYVITDGSSTTFIKLLHKERKN